MDFRSGMVSGSIPNAQPGRPARRILRFGTAAIVWSTVFAAAGCGADDSDRTSKQQPADGPAIGDVAAALMAQADGQDIGRLRAAGTPFTFDEAVLADEKGLGDMRIVPPAEVAAADGDVSIDLVAGTPGDRFPIDERTPAAVPFAVRSGGACRAGAIVGDPALERFRKLDLGDGPCSARAAGDIILDEYSAAASGAVPTASGEGGAKQGADPTDEELVAGLDAAARAALDIRIANDGVFASDSEQRDDLPGDIQSAVEREMGRTVVARSVEAAEDSSRCAGDDTLVASVYLSNDGGELGVGIATGSRVAVLAFEQGSLRLAPGATDCS